MKDLLNSISRTVKTIFTYEVKGFAGEAAPPEGEETNPAEFLHIGTSHQYDQVGGGQHDHNNTKPPKGMILLPFLSDGAGYDEGDSPPDTMVSISITKGGIAETLNFSVENSNYAELYANGLEESTIVNENAEGEGKFFTIANPGGDSFITYVECDSSNELIQVTHSIQDSFTHTGCMLLINKSLVQKDAPAAS